MIHKKEILDKKTITIIYRSFEKMLEVRDLELKNVSNTYINRMRCIEFIDFIKFQENISFSFNIQIMFDNKYNFDYTFFRNMLFKENSINVYSHGLTTQTDYSLIIAPIYLLKFHCNPKIR
jgi:hypothetical protein